MTRRDYPAGTAEVNAEPPGAALTRIVVWSAAAVLVAALVFLGSGDPLRALTAAGSLIGWGLIVFLIVTDPGRQR